MPYQIDHLDDETHYTTAFRRFYERLQNLGQYTTSLLMRCAQEDEDYEGRSDTFFSIRHTFVIDEAERLQRLFDVWLEYYIINIESMKEIRNDVMAEEIDPATARPRVIRSTMGYSTFIEVSRLFYLLNRPRILIDETESEKVSLKNTKNRLWISIVGSFDITAQYAEKEDPDLVVEERLAKLKTTMWEKSVLDYAQSEIIVIVFFLSQQLNELKMDCIEEFRVVFEGAWIRASILMQEAHPAHILDDVKMRQVLVLEEDAAAEEPLFVSNRLFGTFIAMYMGEMARRLFYYDLLHKKPMIPAPLISADMVSRIQEWVTTILNGIADEAYVDTYMEHCAFAYNFIGDEKWFRFSRPTEVMSLQACLAAFRPHLYRRYFSEDRVSKKMLMDAVPDSYVARTYIFKVISMYVQMKTGNTEIKWDRGVVINSDGIQMSAYMLESNQAPILLQVISSYWCYDAGRVYMTDNVFEALTVWFYLFHTKYKDMLYTHTLESVVSEVLAIPAQPTVRGRVTTTLLL